MGQQQHGHGTGSRGGGPPSDPAPDTVSGTDSGTVPDEVSRVDSGTATDTGSGGGAGSGTGTTCTGTGTTGSSGTDSGEALAAVRELGPVRDRALLEAMGEQICSLAGQIAAATARFLTLLGEFDEAEGWGGAGIRSCAHWLSWRCGMDLRTAREHVRVARSLRVLPVTAAEFGAGRLSYSKVRAIARVAEPDTETDLVAIAQHAPAAHVERLCAGLHAASHEDTTGTDQGPDAAQADPSRRWYARWRWDQDTGDLIISARYGATDGAVLLAAITRAEHERTRTTTTDATVTVDTNDTDGAVTVGGDADDAPVVSAADGSAEPPAGALHTPGGDPAGEVVADERQWRADLTGPPPSDPGPALLAMACITLETVAAPVQAPAAEVLFLHGPPETMAGSPGNGSAEPPSAGGPRRAPVSMRVDGGPALSGQAAAEVLCTATGRDVTMTGGCVLSYGRRRRTASPAQLRALHLRDRCCQMPGCGRTRFLKAHHVTYWGHGGSTDLDNLVLLCSSCHTALHLGRFTITALGGQRFEFRDTQDRPIPPAPPTEGTADLILHGRRIHPHTIGGHWGGEPLDLPYATSVLLHSWNLHRNPVA